MPRCILGTACNFPEGEVRPGHPCRRCGHGVHILCAIVDETQPLSSNATCLFCAGVITQPNVLQGPRSVDPKTFDSQNKPPKKVAPASTKNRTKLSVTNTSRAAAGPTRKPPPSKLKKSKEEQGFTVEAPKMLKDYVIQKPVAFDIHDGNYGEAIYKHFLGITKDEIALNASLTTIGHQRYLLGSVAKEVKRKGAGKKYYDIQWEHDILGCAPVDFQVILAANELYYKIQKPSNSGNRNNKFLEKNIRKSFAVIDDLNQGRLHQNGVPASQ